MVNTLSGSVCAYRKETVKPRFIRIDEVMALLDVTQDEAMDIALAAGAIPTMMSIRSRPSITLSCIAHSMARDMMRAGWSIIAI